MREAPWILVDVQGKLQAGELGEASSPLLMLTVIPHHQLLPSLRVGLGPSERSLSTLQANCWSSRPGRLGSPLLDSDPWGQEAGTQGRPLRPLLCFFSVSAQLTVGAVEGRGGQGQCHREGGFCEARAPETGSQSTEDSKTGLDLSWKAPLGQLLRKLLSQVPASVQTSVAQGAL